MEYSPRQTTFLTNLKELKAYNVCSQTTRFKIEISNRDSWKNIPHVHKDLKKRLLNTEVKE